MKIEIEGFPTMSVDLRGSMEDEEIVLSLPWANEEDHEFTPEETDWLRKIYDSQGLRFDAKLIGEETWLLSGAFWAKISLGDCCGDMDMTVSLKTSERRRI
ncbi:MAG: hypothetical protein ACREGR_03850 [Minisyncoccia bacterium]